MQTVEEKKAVKEAKDVYDKQKEELDRIYAEVCKEMGPKEREFNDVLENVLQVTKTMLLGIPRP